MKPITFTCHETLPLAPERLPSKSSMWRSGRLSRLWADPRHQVGGIRDENTERRRLKHPGYDLDGSSHSKKSWCGNRIVGFSFRWGVSPSRCPGWLPAS